MVRDRQLQRTNLLLTCTSGWSRSSFGCAWLFTTAINQICLTSWWAEPHCCWVAVNNWILLYCSRELDNYFLDNFSWPLSYISFLLCEQTPWPSLCPCSQPSKVQLYPKFAALSVHLLWTLPPSFILTEQLHSKQCRSTYTAARAGKLLRKNL